MAAIINYNSITINNKELALSGTAKVSFVAPYNEVVIKFTPTTSLNVFMARVTHSDEDYDLTLGKMAIYETNIAGNVQHTSKLAINSTNFDTGNISYRISLYGCDAVTGVWDITYLFMSLNGTTASTWDTFIPKDADKLEVVSDVLINKE